MITAREFLNVLAILESIDDVPGMPVPDHIFIEATSTHRAAQVGAFVANPVRFLRRADDTTRAAIWAEVKKRAAEAVPMAMAAE